MLEGWWGGPQTDGPLTCTPIRGTFKSEIHQRGTIECASNVEVKCDVEARGFYFTNILEAVPEGTHVEKGDFLIQLDSSPLEELLVKQEIHCVQYEAALIQAETWLETCRFNLNEYVNGLLPQSQQTLTDAVVRAEEKFRQAAQTHRLSQTMYRQGFVTQISLEADAYAMERARVDLKTARMKLDVLDKYKSRKRRSTLESSLAVAQANVRWRRHVYDLQLKELENLHEQIENCTIKAPSAGQVVHANIYHNGHSHLIEPGAFVWRKRVLMKLPNSDEMHIMAHIPEAKVAQVHKGQKVRICCEAFPDVEFRGTVELVDEFPSETPWWGPQMKCYETTIAIDGDSLDSAPVDLRPGLTADLVIEVGEKPDQLMVPFQAVLKHGPHTYCLTKDRRGFHAHEVKTGVSNGKFVVIQEGIEEGCPLVLGAAKYRKEVDLPKLKGAATDAEG